MTNQTTKQSNETDHPRPTGSRYTYEDTDTDCPQGCSDTDPVGQGMRRITHFTGEYETIEVYGESEVIERTERYLECRVCGRVMDV